MKISVALCTYNGEKFLKQQLESILNQKVKVDEIIVCDDVSTDSTLSILNHYQLVFPVIFKVFTQNENIGYVRNFEKALSLCNNEIILLCDQDDLWAENKVEKTVAYFHKNPEIDLVAHQLGLLDSIEEKKTFWELKNFGAEEKNYKSEKLLEHILTKGNVFPGMSLAMRKSFLERSLPLQKIDKIIIHDYELIIKALKENRFGILDEILGFYRQHENQSIGYQKKKKKLDILRRAEFYDLSNQYSRLKNYTAAFGLKDKVAENFKKEIKEKYKQHLNEFPLHKRVLIYLKDKYYYKIINF